MAEWLKVSLAPDLVEWEIDNINQCITDYASRTASSPFLVLWLVEGLEYLGSIQIRPRLTKELAFCGGHVYLDIRPSTRNRGYGTKLLELGKEYAKTELGMDTLLLSVAESNLASRKLIEKCGGTLLNKVVHPRHKKPFYNYEMRL